MSDSQESTAAALANDMEKFLKSYKDKEGKYKYYDMINDMMAMNHAYITVDYLDLMAYNRNFSDLLVKKPDEIFEAFKDGLLSILRNIHPDYEKEIHDKVRVRICNFLNQRGLREINSDVIEKFVSMSAMIVRTSEVKPFARELSYRCTNCNTVTQAELQGISIKPPSKCPACSEKELKIDYENSTFIDFQLIRLQELPEDLPAGQLPHYVEAIAIGDLVNQCRPGDRVNLVGIVRIEQENPKLSEAVTGGKSALFRLRVEANNIEHVTGKDRDENISITPDDEKFIKSLASRPDAYNKLIESFAPHIYGYNEIKEAILLVIVGSISKKLEGMFARRGDINILLVGDPGTAKSEMLKFAVGIAPRGLYTSGRGSSAAGLTAAVVRDKSGVLMLEAGAVVLADQGLCAVDEFDKLRHEDRSALHEVMEQQTCSVARGGIVATLNARTSILAAANPMIGKYDPHKNITDNVNLPIPLLTRFDLIFVVRDIPEKEKDNAVAMHILKVHQDTKQFVKSIIIDPDIFSKYLAYAKKRIQPELTKEALDLIHAYYMKMRNMGESPNMITVTPRQLEGLVRLATARARLLLKEYVDSADAERAIYLVQKMLETVGVDVKTGKTDPGVLYGKPVSLTNKINACLMILDFMAKGSSDGSVEENALVKDMITSRQFDTETDALDTIKATSKAGIIYECMTNRWKRSTPR